MFSTDFIFRQQENLVDNQKCQAGFRPLCNKILFLGLCVQANLPETSPFFVCPIGFGEHLFSNVYSTWDV